MTTKRQFIDTNGNTWEWDETPDTLKAIQRLHDDYRRMHAQTPPEAPVTPKKA